MLQLLKAADLGGQFLDLVVEEVKHLQVLQFRYVWGHSYGNGDATCEFKVSRMLAMPFPCKRKRGQTPGLSTHRSHLHFGSLLIFVGNDS